MHTSKSYNVNNPGLKFHSSIDNIIVPDININIINKENDKEKINDDDDNNGNNDNNDNEYKDKELKDRKIYNINK